jgi:hypothetical protein
MTLLTESGAYDGATGVLDHDPELKIYDIEPGLDEVTAPLVGVDPGPSLHFVLNNKVFKDNRIPPRGFTNAAYADFGGAHVFLRDENTTNTKGQEMYDLWNDNGKCPPEVMAQTQIALGPPLPGDCDGNGVVDLDDFADFEACLLGVGGGLGPGCDCFDFDANGDVDLSDFAEFQVAFAGTP